MTEFEELSAFLPLLELHGLSKWWLYKQWHDLSAAYKWARTSNGRKRLCYVPRGEMEARILIASKRPGIAIIIAKMWNVLVGKRMTHIVSRSHGTWQRHYGTARSRSRVVITTPEDILALQPRFYFFYDFLDLLEPVLAEKDFLRLKKYLDSVQKCTKKIITQKCNSIHVQNKLSELNYEEFYNNLLDKILYGVNQDEAFESALSMSPLCGEHISSFELQPAYSDMVEKAPTSSFESDKIFEMDFSKLKRQFFRALLSERLKNTSAAKPKQVKARKEAGLDMAIFFLHIQHITDDDICRKLHFKGTRQRLTQRRVRVLEKARSVFSTLRE